MVYRDRIHRLEIVWIHRGVQFDIGIGRDKGYHGYRWVEGRWLGKHRLGQSAEGIQREEVPGVHRCVDLHVNIRTGKANCCQPRRHARGLDGRIHRFNVEGIDIVIQTEGGVDRTEGDGGARAEDVDNRFGRTPDGRIWYE